MKIKKLQTEIRNLNSKQSKQKTKISSLKEQAQKVNALIKEKEISQEASKMHLLQIEELKVQV